MWAFHKNCLHAALPFIHYGFVAFARSISIFSSSAFCIVFFSHLEPVQLCSAQSRGAELFPGNFLFSVCVLFIFIHLSCGSRQHAFTLLHHGFGLDCGLRCERVRPSCFSGAPQRLLEQHEPKVSISLYSHLTI